MHLDRPNNNQCHIIGLIDDDPNMKERIAFGFRVLGALRDIPELTKQHAITKIIVAAELSKERLYELLAVAEQYGLSVTEWVPVERVLLVDGHRENEATNSDEELSSDEHEVETSTPIN